MPPFSSTPFPFVYECRCGAVEVVTDEDVSNHAVGATRPREAADIVLTERYGWADAKHCGDCNATEYSLSNEREPIAEPA